MFGKSSKDNLVSSPGLPCCWPKRNEPCIYRLLVSIRNLFVLLVLFINSTYLSTCAQQLSLTKTFRRRWRELYFWQRWYWFGPLDGLAESIGLRSSKTFHRTPDCECHPQIVSVYHGQTVLRWYLREIWDRIIPNARFKIVLLCQKCSIQKHFTEWAMEKLNLLLIGNANRLN